MEHALAAVVEKCLRALDTADPQASVRAVLLEAARDPTITCSIAGRTKFASLSDLAIFRSDDLTLLAGVFPPGFSVGPHNHNLWSVVAVCSGREDNLFFERDGPGLRQTGQTSVVAPGVLPNDADVIHAIHNPLEEPLVVLHAYGGDLLATPRSNWDPETHEEIPFDWQKASSDHET